MNTQNDYLAMMIFPIWYRADEGPFRRSAERPSGLSLCGRRIPVLGPAGEKTD
jgi:hypothetical protein